MKKEEMSCSVMTSFVPENVSEPVAVVLACLLFARAGALAGGDATKDAGTGKGVCGEIWDGGHVGLVGVGFA